mmetsp:Transcript_6509/g.18720  ORF Transcript_6509/g.18720 Transcript_6509/m.18720 type:complete len:227 (-) Transcript_6509:107-787(-)
MLSDYRPMACSTAVSLQATKLRGHARGGGPGLQLRHRSDKLRLRLGQVPPARRLLHRRNRGTHAAEVQQSGPLLCRVAHPVAAEGGSCAADVTSGKLAAYAGQGRDCLLQRSQSGVLEPRGLCIGLFGAQLRLELLAPVLLCFHQQVLVIVVRNQSECRRCEERRCNKACQHSTPGRLWLLSVRAGGAYDHTADCRAGARPESRPGRDSAQALLADVQCRGRHCAI